LCRRDIRNTAVFIGFLKFLSEELDEIRKIDRGIRSVGNRGEQRLSEFRVEFLGALRDPGCKRSVLSPWILGIVGYYFP
jgi:hypothetical protein